MALIFDAVTRLVVEIAEPGNPSVVAYDLFSDLFVPLADWHRGKLSINFPLRQAGGEFLYTDNLDGPVYGPSIFFLQNQPGENWRIRPANYDHEILFVAATLLPQEAATPLFDMSGITAKIIFRPVLALAQAGYFLDSGGGGAGGFTSSDRAALLAIQAQFQNLMAGLGRLDGVSATQRDPSPVEPGYLRTDDGRVDQEITLNPDGSVTIRNRP